MSKLKVNPAGQEEVFNFFLSEREHPIAFKAKLDELIEAGLTEEQARVAIEKYPTQMEVYYSPDKGLFMVETEAFSSIPVHDPYTGEEMENIEDEDVPTQNTDQEYMTAYENLRGFILDNFDKTQANIPQHIIYDFVQAGNDYLDTLDEEVVKEDKIGSMRAVTALQGFYKFIEEWHESYHDEEVYG